MSAKKRVTLSTGAEETASKRTATDVGATTEATDELEFEDPYEDEIDEEDEAAMEYIRQRELKREKRRTENQNNNVDDDDEDDDDDDDDILDEVDEQEAEMKDDVESKDNQDEKKKPPIKYVWKKSDGMDADEQLEYDSTAYSMLHRLKVEWPCLSFDIVPDSLGVIRLNYPHTVFLVGGTQADLANKNKIVLLKCRELHKTKHDDADSDDENESDDEDDHLDDDPIVEERSVPHHGAVNRIRVCPQAPSLVATQSETGKTHIYDLGAHLKNLESSGGPVPAARPLPIFTYTAQAEGYALQWSKLIPYRLAMGNCASQLVTFSRNESGTFVCDQKFYKGHTSSVEDIEWSPTEEHVFASCSSDKTIRIWDDRVFDRNAAMVAAHKTDVNVISWNMKRANLLASGADNGQMKIWDLRRFVSSSPAALFDWHRDAITSIQWHPEEESMLAASSADDTVTIWDLALESDAEEIARHRTGAEVRDELPAQLFFVHAGQSQIKELHWHKQIPSCLVTTSADGFNIFKPDNLEA